MVTRLVGWLVKGPGAENKPLVVGKGAARRHESFFDGEVSFVRIPDYIPCGVKKIVAPLAGRCVAGGAFATEDGNGILFWGRNRSIASGKSKHFRWEIFLNLRGGTGGCSRVLDHLQVHGRLRDVDGCWYVDRLIDDQNLVAVGSLRSNYVGVRWLRSQRVLQRQKQRRKERSQVSKGAIDHDDEPEATGR